MVVAEAYDKAKSSQQFYSLLKDKGHQLYKRGNHIVGIVENRKWRFKTLGYSKEKIQLLDRNIEKEKRLGQIKKLHQSKNRNQNREL